MSILCSMVGASFVSATVTILRSKKSIAAVGNAQIDTAQSKFGGSSALFDGTDDYLAIYDFPALGTADFTIEFWAYDTTWATSIVFDARDSAGSINPVIYYDASNIRYLVNAADRIVGGSLTNSTWNHIAISRASGSTKMFINGTQVGSTYADSNNYTAVAAAVLSTNYAGAADFSGWIDEFRLSNSARYTANFTPSTTPFTNDANTLLLIHADGTDASTFFEDDNGVRSSKSIVAIGDAQIDTAQSKFGGSSILFDGTGDYLNVSTNTAFTIAGDFTVELWYRASATNAALIPFFNTSDHLFYIGYSGGNPVYDVFSGGSNRTTLNAISGWSLNTWYHVAYVRSGSTIKIYHNGTQTTSGTWSATVNTGNPNQIGLYGGSYLFQGHIDELRVSNTARYTTNFTAPTTPFVNDANTVLLIHGDGTDAVKVIRDDNGARSQKGIVALGNAQIDTAQSKFGGSSALFDGTGDYLVTPAHTDYNFGTDNFTIECWVRITGDSTANSGGTRYANILATVPSGAVGTNYEFGLIGSSTTTGTGLFFNSWVAGTGYAPSATFTFSKNTWYHIAVSRTSGNIQFFVDGTQIGTTQSHNVTTNCTNDMRIAGTAVTAYKHELIGYIDELRVSNSARYATTFTPSTTPFQNDSNTLLLLHMDGTDASTVFFDDNGIAPYNA
jgi:hypothetical protein